RARAGDQNVHAAAERRHVRTRGEQRQDVERRRSADDERHEAKIGAELPQHRRKSPQARIHTAAGVALVIAHADERPTRGTDDRAGGFPLEHGRDHIPGSDWGQTSQIRTAQPTSAPYAMWAASVTRKVLRP